MQLKAHVQLFAFYIFLWLFEYEDNANHFYLSLPSYLKYNTDLAQIKLMSQRQDSDVAHSRYFKWIAGGSTWFWNYLGLSVDLS